MISDVLAEAVDGLDCYLNDPTWNRAYCGDFREKIVRLRNEAEYIRVILDTPPEIIIELIPESIMVDRIEDQRFLPLARRLYVTPEDDVEAVSVFSYERD
jgi:hypothetical protein